MAKTRVPNPLAFRRTPVTFIGTLTYVALLAALLWTHTTVPPAPPTAFPEPGLNLSQAWLDLEFLSDGYHPWGSRRNDAVHAYLLRRVHEILDANGVGYQTVYDGGDGRFSVAGDDVEGGRRRERRRGTSEGSSSVGKGKKGRDKDGGDEKDRDWEPAVTVFASDSSNFTAWDDWTRRPWTLYGESTNILVYIRGEGDAAGDWWNATTGDDGEAVTAAGYTGQSGVLVNAHYDSVSTGYGATDDGVGVASVLQLISYFTRDGHRPKRGLVAMLNNGEEDGLYGARNYLQHPVSQFPHTFLNLEGAGAGGRAMLFRSTDEEVTEAYAKSPRPFGTVVSGDGFKRGAIKSGTDYSVLTERLGMRGLDVAFYAPRARYHTNQDGARDTSRDSLWHMLSAALATVKELTSFAGDEFEGPTDAHGKIDAGPGSDAVWFDMFGRAFAVMRLHTLFAVSVTLLVAGPVLLLVSELLIRRSGKWYLLAGRRHLRSPDDDESVHLHGRRGVFRFPVAVAVSSAAVVALAFLQTKINPYIIYSSEYAVWAMMLSAWSALAWFFFAGAANVRPTALQRVYSLIWLYAASWVLLVLATVGENNFRLASGYFLVIFNASAFVALLVSYLELFSLPQISKYVERVLRVQGDDRSFRSGGRSSTRVANESIERVTTNNEEAQPTETTSLLRGERSERSSQTFTVFRRKRPDRDEVPADTADPLLNQPYLEEQAWSTSLLRWTWFFQFLILVPINVILIGQVSLLVTTAVHQTPGDGNPVLPTYIMIAVLSILLLLPLTPFIHRFTYKVPTFLFLVFVGCLIYNLTAFPFSRDARMKVYFSQSMDLDSGANTVSLTGLGRYLHRVLDEMPSAAVGPIDCIGKTGATIAGLQTCTWAGLEPNVVPRDHAFENSRNSSKLTYKDWLSHSISSSDHTASIVLQGLNTKICYLQFDNPVSEVHVAGGGQDPRLRVVPEGGTSMVRLFSRSWDKKFNVTVSWRDAPAKGQRGRAICAWNDVNQHGTIPAFDEILRFHPVWTAVTKITSGLLEGWKAFEV